MDQPTRLRAREHLRVSADQSKRQRSIDDQRTDNREAADRYGWELGEPYNDGVVSASAYSNKPREGFDQLLEDLTTDNFNAEILISWANDRQTREMDEATELVTLCKKRGVKIYVTSHDKLYDPANPRDRRSLLEDAIDAEWYSAKLSVTVSRAKKADAASGRPGGGWVAYGYTAVGQRENLRWEINEDEAKVIREVADHVLAGKSLRSEVDRLNRHGPKPRRVERWTITALKRVITNPSLAGLRTHHKEIIGKAQWDAVLSEETWQEVCDTVASRAKQGAHKQRSLLAGSLQCRLCGGPIVAERAEKYRCSRITGCGRVTIAKKPLEEYVWSEVLKHGPEIERQRQSTESTGDHAPDPRIAEIEAEISRWERKIEEADDAYEQDVISAAQYFPRLGRYRDTINELRKELARLTSEWTVPRVPSATDQEVSDDVRALLAEWPTELRDVEWTMPSTESQRAFISRYLQKVIIKPTVVRGRSRFDADRVQILWRD